MELDVMLKYVMFSVERSLSSDKLKLRRNFELGSCLKQSFRNCNSKWIWDNLHMLQSEFIYDN